MTNEKKSQQIVAGIEHLNGIVEELHARKVLVVADASFASIGIRRQVEDIPAEHVFFNDFGSNPLYDDVCKGVALFNRSGCDSILAVGGGSCIDVAKCIKLYCKMDPDTLYLHQEYRDSHVPLIAIPTTAGTGSESTRFAVIYYNGVKQSVTHPSIIPDYALLEPTVLATLPLYQKKCTVLDALCQGIESWWSVNSTPQSHVLSSDAVKTLIDNIEPYIFENSSAAASRVMYAANRAGQAINITQTTAPHAFSYKLTSLYRLTHGHAVAICLPEIWQYMLDNPDQCIDPRGWDYLNNIFALIANAMHCLHATDAVEQFRLLLDKLEIKAPSATEREDELSLLTQSVNPDRLKNNPVRLDLPTIHTLYNKILK